MTKFTIFGANGFIGSNLVNHLQEIGIDCYAPDIRKEDVANKHLGHVIYSIGVPNANARPFDAVNAHVCLLQDIIKHNNFDSFLYLSGTRVYHGASSTREEDNMIVNSTNLDHIYNISKLTGESICFAINNPSVRVARLSNVTGNAFHSTLFIPSILREAVTKKRITVNTSLESEKDYIWIDDVVKILPEISLRGKSRIYNVASGINIKSREIIKKIQRFTDCEVEVRPDAKEYSFPLISVEKLQNEFQFTPSTILDKIEYMVNSYKDFL